ncbi:tRNA (adenosine(37)-N6)-dimethylallyltransferase MiaA [Demequina lignilytica]|uniref:tRNA dimethylallyltransferase n=1 Tax=Demequina lignilytica TaxID=3051663 RepID=A0AB35MJV8_9MICO|nr:tRNA (adenosine(37)-N6)-dimethylallyltransferase MiaA [Demequina sp. SYSU T0a273]MDN4483990.1 tRNA (adenosine(37)-N6)-dimethylallyltransferase MiaA [Demequina sp. SYSU T0a273]
MTTRSGPTAARDDAPAIVAVVGATATGKSAVSLDLAGALDGEIVNADSMQFYRGMDIGTAKLPLGERRGIPHHQLDTLDVHEDASVARFQAEARADIAAIHARGRRAIVVGGSGLYLRALLDVFEFPGTDPALRAALEARADAEGPGALHRELAAVDPEAAAKIPPQNVKRLVRALEIIALTGSTRSSLPRHAYAAPAVTIALDLAYEVLDPRIGARVDAMWEQGLVDEVRGLEARGLREGVTARRAVGYAETLRHLDGELDAEETRELIAQHTRRLARKQAQWFRPDPRVRWIGAPVDPDDVARASADALAQVRAADAA